MAALMEVTQADRDAAADLWEHHAGRRWDFHREIARGSRDDHYSVQAFARHRLTHSEPRPVAGEPVAWSYRLATAVSGDGTYSRWDKGPRLSWEKPTVPEGSIRDLTPLYAATHSPAPTEAGEVGKALALACCQRLAKRMATACDRTRAGKDHIKVNTADWHGLMDIMEQAKALSSTQGGAER